MVLCAGVYGSPPILLRSGLELPGIGDNLCDHTTVGPAIKGPQLHTITSFRSEETPPEEPPDLLFWIADPSGDPPSASIELLLMKPRSRGSVWLRSRDPADAPVITLPNLNDLSDVRRLAEGYRHAVELAVRPELHRFCPQPAVGSGDEDWIRAHATSVPHFVGTCAMGTVVDADGRLSEHRRLWVADASVIPDSPSGFVHVPIVMVAERLSERIASEL